MHEEHPDGVGQVSGLTLHLSQPPQEFVYAQPRAQVKSV